MLGWFVPLCLPDELIGNGLLWGLWSCSEGKVQDLKLEKHFNALVLSQIIKASVMHMQTSQEANWDGWILQRCLFVLQVPLCCRKLGLNWCHGPQWGWRGSLGSPGGLPWDVEDLERQTMVWRVEGVVTYVLQICISSGNWPDSGLRTSLLGESRQFCNIPPSSQTFVAWQPAPPSLKKTPNS